MAVRMSETLKRVLALCAQGETRISDHGYDELAEDGIVLSIENYTFNRMFNHKFMIYNDKYQFSLSHV
jgi:hypothetical protein